MPLFLSGITAKIAAVLILIMLGLAGLLYVQHLRSALTISRASIATLASANQADQTAMMAYQDQVRHGEQAADALAERLQVAAASNAALHAKIRAGAAQPGQDGAVAPVLAETMDAWRVTK